MGTFFSVYSTTELINLDQEKRAELKWAIEQALQHDPDVQRLVADKLPEIRALLKQKTRGGFDRLNPKP